MKTKKRPLSVGVFEGEKRQCLKQRFLIYCSPTLVHNHRGERCEKSICEGLATSPHISGLSTQDLH